MLTQLSLFFETCQNTGISLKFWIKPFAVIVLNIPLIYRRSTGIEDDSIPPVIYTCPEHIYEVLQPDHTTSAINWNPPTARDGSGLPVAVHQTHSPGDQFTVGGYELVKYTFIDAAGNEAVCEFAVTLYPYGEFYTVIVTSTDFCFVSLY